MISNERFIRELDYDLFKETGIHNCYEKYCGQLPLEAIFTTDSVAIAAYHCASGFRDRQDTFYFMSHVWQNSYKLAKKVAGCKFTPEYYKTVKIMERGKPRSIRPPKFECKVIQKVLCDYLLRTLLEPKMISTSYASIRGRGTQLCYTNILNDINRKAGNGSYIVITDFTNYFGSIDHDILRNQLSRYIKDKRVVDLYMSFCESDEGLSLGNEASQVPASWFPSPLDHVLKDKLRYIEHRYMDDILVVAKDEQEADEAIEVILKESEKLKLTVHEEKIKKLPWGTDFIFCKERFLFNKEKQYYYCVMNPSIMRTEMRKINHFLTEAKTGTLDFDQANTQINMAIGMINGQMNTKKQIQKLKRKKEEINKYRGEEKAKERNSVPQEKA